jgi:cell division cycle-associated protein 7
VLLCSFCVPLIDAQTPRKRPVRDILPDTERRRSSRDVKKVDYFGMDEPGYEAGDRRVRTPRVVRAPSNAPRAVFSVGGRVYDSELGVTCHWCRQKTVETHVTCMGAGCSGARLPLAFCGMCLSNRHGEDIDDAVASGCWECPRCRGSCGDGCVTCCNCGPCRKKAGLMPTHQMIQLARAHGFDNVHDYLVHRETGEDAETIAERKLTFPWGKWLRDDFCRPVADKEEEEEQEQVVALSSADEESARDVSSSENATPAESESDDAEYMVVHRTPKKRRVATSTPSASSPNVVTPAQRGGSSPTNSRQKPNVKTSVARKSVASKPSKSGPTPAPIAGDDIYEFEAILDRRKRGRGEQLLIKWRGFDESQATWEPATNIIANA